MDKLQLGKSVKAKRNSQALSQSDLAFKSGVSSAVIGKIEKGESVKEENLAKVLLTLGMRDTLVILRREEVIAGHKALTVEELKVVVVSCREIIRDSQEQREKEEFMNYRNLAEEELKFKIREIFRGA
jgi:transcriptional regulator with XRE-family HTH domain